MTLDEIIGLFQKRVAMPDCPHNWREALKEAIVYLRKCKEDEGWEEWPTCPKCGTNLDYWREGENKLDPVSWECPHHGDVAIETRYRVKEPS